MLFPKAPSALMSVLFKNGSPIPLPASRQDIGDLVGSLAAAKGQTWLDVLYAVKSVVGAHPYVRFLIARAVHAKRLKTAVMKKKAAEHQQREEAWWAGGREAHYFKKHRFGGHHAWFQDALFGVTGMTSWDLPEWEEEWDAPTDEGEETPKTVKRVVCPHCRLRSCTGEFCEWLSRPLEEPVVTTPPKMRSIMLLTKLRALLRSMRAARHNMPQVEVIGIPWQHGCLFECARPQMEGANGEELPTIKSSNVVLTEANPGSTAVASQNRFSYGWHQLCSTEKPTKSDYLLDRWTLVMSKTWSSVNQATDYELAKLDLPYDIITPSDGTFPLAINFKIFKYYKGDIELKIHVNSNKFQVGQLMCSFQYMEKFDGNPLTSVYSRCQLPHVLINAGASNEATLTIPYKFVQPYLFTAQRSKMMDCLYIGSFKIHVVVPLAVGEKGPKDCGLSIFARLPNSEFVGMCDGGIQFEMEAAAAAMVAAEVYNRTIGDTNCDNPTNNVNPQYFIPTGTHSWCNGTGTVDRLQSLRLDGSTSSVGRSGIDNSETSIGVPCRTFGMLNHFKWESVDTTKNKVGYVLWDCDVNAQIDLSKCKKFDSSTDLDSYCLPPVSVVAGLYKCWRGSLEFKFDIIASQFHTGRLLCVYIPGAYGDKIAKMDKLLYKARNCPSIEFSLQDATSFTFTVPYISQSPWWARKYTGPHKYSERASPSKLLIFILNPLIPMESVVNKVTIVPYVRAGPDFEVCIPVQPSIGLSDCIINNVARGELVYPTTGSFPFRATNYKGFGDDKKYICYEGTAALGTASTFHSSERKLADNEYYYCKFEKPAKIGNIKYKEKGKEQVYSASIGYLVLWHVPGYGNYGIPFPAGSVGQQYADRVAQWLRLGKPVDEILQFCFDYIEDSTTSSSDFNDLIALPQYQKVPDTRQREDSLSLTDLEISETSEVGSPQMENRYEAPNNLAPTAPLPSTSGGGYMYNENFSDLKDIARRYQIYCQKTIEFPKNYVSGGAAAVVPIIPHGLALDVEKSTSIFNVCRDGPIPVISSGYIFFRGSLRFKFVFSTNNPQIQNSKIWIQHHPDSDVLEPTCQVFPNIVEEDGFKSHGYSFYIQNGSVNSIIELEVPFYQPGMYGLTRKPSKDHTNLDLRQYYNLGSLILGFNMGTLTDEGEVTMQVYYSISDDFSFNTFRGFPPMVMTDQVWSVPAKEKSIVWITGSPQMEEGQPEMFKSFKDYIIGSSISAVSDQAMEIAKKTLDDEVDKVKAMYDKAVNKTRGWDVSSEQIAGALGNLLHVIANPKPKTIAISIANVIMSFFVKSVISLIKMVEAVTEVLHNYWDLFTGADSGSPQMDYDPTKCLQGLVGLIFAGVCTMLGATLTTPKNFPNILRDINSGVSLGNNCIRFIQNCSDLVIFCIKYVLAYLNPSKALEIQLADQVPEIKTWYEECAYLLDVRNKSKYLYDRCMLSRVFDACVLGSILVSSGIDDRVPAGKLIFDTHKEMRKLQTDLFERGAHPDVRFETFPIWISGEPGIGKSYLIKKLVNDLLRSIAFSQSGSLIYDIPSGAKYWSGCQNPAALVSDDLFQVNGTKLEEEIANIFLICSSSVLNPPFAAVEDKERRLNPLLYVMLCNSHFPNLSPTCNHPEAVYRRRKFLIQAEIADDVWKDENFVDASQLPREMTTNMRHLKFKIAHNVKNPDTTYSNYMTYDELLDLIRPAFKKHYEDERLNFKDRMRNMYCLDPNYNDLNVIDELPGIGEHIPLSEQILTFKNHIRDELDRINDPQFPTGIKACVEKMKIAWKSCMKKSQAVFQMEEPDVAKIGESLIKDRVHDVDPAMIGEMMSKKIQDMKEINAGFVPGKCNLELIEPEFYAYLVEEKKDSKCLLPPEYFPPGTRLLLPNSLGSMNSAEQGIFYQDLAGACFSFLQIDTIDNTCLKTWYSNSINKMFEIGAFSTFEMMKFLCSFRGGHHCVLEVMYPDYYKVTGFSEIDKPIIGITVHKELSNNDHMAKANDALYHNVLKKDQIRKALSEIKLMSPVKARQHFLNASRFYLWKKYCQTIAFTSSSVAVDDFVEKARNVDDFISFRVAVILLKGSANIMKKTDPKTQHKLLSYFKDLYALLCLADKLFYTPGVSEFCSKFNMLARIAENPTHAGFCSVRRSLIYGKATIDKCSGTDCLYNNDLFYYFLCMCSVSCAKFVESKRDVFGNEIPERYEYDDIYRALRIRRKQFTMGIFARLGRYCKHWFYHVLPECISSIYTALKFIVPKLLVTLAVGFGLAGAQYAWNHYGGGAAHASAQANYFKFDGVKHPKIKHPKIAAKSFARAEMGCEQRVTMAKLIERNSVLIHASYVEGGQRQVRRARCLMLRGRCMLVLRHYLEEYAFMIQQGANIEFTLMFSQGKQGQSVRVNTTWEDISTNVAWCSSDAKTLTSNFGIVTLPNYIPQFKDIVNRFASQNEHSNVPSFGDMYVVNGESSFNMPISIAKNFKVVPEEASSAVYLDVTYKYFKQYPGLCGSVLVGASLGSGSGAIIGMHVAGSCSSGAGYSEPIYREMFLDFFNVCPQPLVMETPVVEDDKPDFELDSNLMMYGCVPKNFAHKESGKSKIVPSLLHNQIYPCKTEPNPLRPNDPRQPPGSHPLRDGCNKHGTGDVKVFDSGMVEEVQEHMCDRFQQIVRPIRAELRPLTLQQAVCGDVNVPYFESLNWKSSEGFPLSTHRPKSAHDKKWLFDLEEGKDGYILKKINPLLNAQLSLRNKCFEQGVKPPTVYVDCLKDYRLTPAKCKIPGKTRIFSIAPVQCSIDIRMYVNDFCASIKNSRIENSIGIGINPDSMEWTQLANYLFEVGGNIITLDYSNFGPCLMSQLVAAGNEVIVQWHAHHGATPEHVKRVKWLLDSDIINPVHLSGNLLYQTVNGISSGSPLTGECNSIPNLFYIRLTYLEIMREHFPDYASMFYFDMFVRIVVYGDDLIMSVDFTIVGVFNALTIRDSLAKHGIKVTSAQKDSEMVPFTSIKEATFLKRSFVEHPFRKGIWLAPIETQSIEECLNWCHECDNPAEATLECCRASLDLAYSQGPEYYAEHYSKIKKQLNEIGLKIEFKTWFSRDDDIFGAKEKDINCDTVNVKIPWYYKK